jgi:hypothetical protein
MFTEYESVTQKVLFLIALIWFMRWACHVTRMGEKRNAYRILVRKAEGKRPLRKVRRRWVDNIKMDLREMDGVG